MQQAKQKSWRQKASRYLIIALVSCGLLIAIVLGITLKFYQKIALDLANHYLASYNTQVSQLAFRPKSLNQWHISNVKLKVDDTDITLTNVDLSFAKDTKPWMIKVSDVKALSVENVEVELAPDALWLSESSSNATGPAVGLDFDSLPELKLNHTRITLKGIEPERLTVDLQNLSLNKFGQFNSQINVNQKPLLTLAAELSDTKWRTNSSLDIGLLHSFIRQLAANEQALLHNSSAVAASGQSLLAPLYQLAEAIDDKHIQINAILNSTLSLDLKTAQISSQHNVSQTNIVLDNFAHTVLRPISLDPDKENKHTDISIDISGHITEPTLTLSAFTLPLSVESDAQLQKLLKKLNDKSLAQGFSQLYQQLRLTSKTELARQTIHPEFVLSLTKGLTYRFVENTLMAPSLSLSLKHSKLQAEMALEAITLAANSTDSSFQLDADWLFSANHEQTLILNNLWPTLKQLPYQISFDNSTVSLGGSLAFNQSATAPQFTINLAKGAEQITKGILLTQLTTHGKRTQNAPEDAIQTKLHIAQTQLTLNSAINYQLKLADKAETINHSTLTLPKLSYKLTDLNAKLLTHNELEQQYELSIANAKLELHKLMQLAFNSASSDITSNPIQKAKQQQTQARISLAQQLLSHKLSNQLSIDVAEIKLDKAGYNRPETKSNQNKQFAKRRHSKQKLAEFNSIKLSQSLRLDQQQIHTDELWQINDLSLTSQHGLALQPSNLKHFSLNGDWQFNSEFAPILAFLSQTDSLPDALEIDGNAEVALHYQLQQSQNLAFNASLAPQVQEISGSVNNLPFEGGNMSTQCQFNWQQDHHKQRKSVFNCDNINLSLQAFNPGVLITDIGAVAAVKFESGSYAAELESESNNEPSKNSNNLALAKHLLGVKQASVALTAKGDLLGGQLLIPQFQLNLKQPSSAYFVLQQIDLEQLLAIQPQVGIAASGIFDGVLPVRLENGKASVSGGQLAARAPGGLIAIGNNPAVEQMRQSQPYLEFAFSALEHLNYSQLSSTFDMDPLGDAILKVNVKGKSRGIERPIHFNYSQEENMLQLLRSLQIGDNLQNQIERAIN
ncbi:YdbH domain-containing protein [Shewanella halifaxensis]|uniref:YdbH domain-containing protein n=1 Tax=Shewanella halifaxensis TaxID=271098 RepID=UPI000D594EF2|nr:YdbH domain-containing protein [Shewanella halifaxensis]